MREPQVDFRLLFEASPEVLLVLLPDAPRYTMVAATRARFAATHTTPEDSIGRGLFEIFPDNPDDPAASGAENLRASLDRVLATRAPDTMAVQKYDIRGKDGSFEAKYWSPRNIPVLSQSGEVSYILHRVEDVTELVRAEAAGEALRDRTREMEGEVVKRSLELAESNRELRKANAKLGELDAAKTAFFHNVSHEFRTPLTLMLGPLEDLLESREDLLSPGQRERTKLVHDNALRLLRLVNALLDFSRLEAGRLEAHYAPLDVAKLTSELAGMFDSALARAGLVLSVDSARLVEPLWVDRTMWEKIVTNLLSNAFKFTHTGEIKLRLFSEGQAFVLEVEDTGVGIPEAELPRIFERFHRVESTEGRTYEGSGIGLSLVRELVLLHGGRVSVRSALGQGSTFRVEIPRGFAHLPADSVSQTPVPLGLSRDTEAHLVEARRLVEPDFSREPGIHTGASDRAKVLVVDDNVELRNYMLDLLSPSYDVTTAGDGIEALAAVRESLPDIVLSDVMMPRMNGIELVRALRDNPSITSLPIILLSARAGEEPTIAGLDAGADDYVFKPFSAKELLSRVRTHVGLARTRRSFVAELESKNRELDAFSYSVAHDLRAPLRAIDGFSRALADECAQGLDARGRDYVERVRKSAQRMTALIDDLMELSRISRANVTEAPVDLSALAAEVVSALKRAQPERSASVLIEPHLFAQGDRRMLKIALENLLGNAWKFTSRREEARIEVGALHDTPGTFFVRDNGVGFDMTYANRLFSPFQRLHAASDFEGTGVGLATVQRVLARHGGRAWVEAAVDQGATFYFSLPTQPT
jgi:signal transduction histidine kinase